MRAPLALAATCMAVSAALLLSACGGSKGDNNKVKDVSSATPTTSPATTTPSASPSASGVKRPTITLPSDAKDVFEDQHTGDPVKDAILADNEGFVRAVDDGIFKGSGTTDALTFYSAGLTNVTAIHGLDGPVDRHLEVFARNGVKTVVIAFANSGGAAFD